VQQADAWPPREIDGRQTGLNVPANLRLMGGEAPYSKPAEPVSAGAGSSVATILCPPDE
jgi:hypothetical protein